MPAGGVAQSENRSAPSLGTWPAPRRPPTSVHDPARVHVLQGAAQLCEVLPHGPLGDQPLLLLEVLRERAKETMMRLRCPQTGFGRAKRRQTGKHPPLAPGAQSLGLSGDIVPRLRPDTRAECCSPCLRAGRSPRRACDGHRLQRMNI